jgi:uncharacterized protein (TIGR00251 family)
MTQLPFLRESRDGILLEVYVQPKASRNEIVGIHDERLRIRLTAPPVEGEANKECVRFLAKMFGLPKSKLDIVQGHKSRQKTILIHELPLKTLQNILKQQGVLS